MAERTPRRRLAGVLIAAAVLTAGCNPALLVSLMMGPPKQQPTLAKLTPPVEKEQARVVIIASAPINTGVDFARIDRDVASAVGRHLQLAYDENKEKIQIVAARKVEKFKDDHTDWYTMDKAEIGNLFHADYVIFLEIESIELYERGSNRLMLHGQTNIAVSLVDMKRPDDEPVKTQFVAEYPTKSRGPVQVEEVNLQQFRHAFLESIAKKLAWHFVEHQTAQEDF
jgi:hypothetical protein